MTATRVTGSTAIRPVRLEDAAEVATLVRQLDYPATPETMRRRLEDMSRRPEYAAWVAETSTVVGFAGAFVGHSFVIDEPYGRVIALVVEEALRGRGIGARLLAAAEEWLERSGANKIVVTSATRREAAHRFYERHGYDITGVRLAKVVSHPQSEAIS